jgi:hypothetical protein
MTHADPWHNLLQNVHHVRTDCPEAKKVASYDKTHRPGTGNKPLCEVCAALVATASKPTEPAN